MEGPKVGVMGKRLSDIAYRLANIRGDGQWKAVDLTDRLVGPNDLDDYEEFEGHPAERMWWVEGIDWLDQDSLYEGEFFSHPDALFIAHAPEDIRNLLAVAEAGKWMDLTCTNLVNIGDDREVALENLDPCDKCAPCRLRIAFEALEGEE